MAGWPDQGNEGTNSTASFDLMNLRNDNLLAHRVYVWSGTILYGRDDGTWAPHGIGEIIIAGS